MPNIDELQIEITTNAKQADDTIDVLVKKLDLLSGSLKNINKINTSGLKKVANNFNNINKTTSSMASGLSRVNTSAQKTTKSFGGLASSIGKFYATWFFVIRGIKSLGRSIEASADYVEAFNYFNVALGKIGSDWSNQFEKYGYENAEAYAESFSKRLQQDLSVLSGLAISTDASGNGLLSSTGTKNLGLNIQEITQFASQLASVTNSVGQTGEVSLATANAFTKLSADMSSLFNIDYSQVMNNLNSALIGQSRSVYKYGIDITNATLQTKAYELGLTKAVSEMSQMEKQQLRVISILEQSKVSWGDLANTINSPSNMLRQFSNNLKEVGMVLGQLFIPLLSKVMPVINGITIAIKNLLTSIAGFLGIKLDLSSFGQGFSGIEEDVDGTTDSLDQATESAKKLRKQLQPFDNLNLITTPTDSGASSGGGVGGGIDLTEQILEATAEYERVWQEAFDRMENQAEVFAKKVLGVFSKIKESVVGYFGELKEKLDLSTMTENLEIVSSFAFDGATSFFKDFLEPMSTWTLSEAFPQWTNLISEFVNGIDWETASELISNAFKLITDITISLGNAFLRMLSEILPELLPFLNELISLINTILKILQPLWSYIDKYVLPALESRIILDLKNILAVAENFVRSLNGILRGIIMFIEGFFTGNWRKAWEGIKQIFTSQWTALFEVGKRIIGNLTATFIKPFYDAFSEAKVTKWFASIPSALESAWKKGVNAAISVLNKFIGAVNEKLEIKWDSFKFMGKKIFDGGSFKLVNIPELQKFETGGFPEDGLFFANHNELVGKFSNGQTAVANNEQIVAGIERGVRDANAEQNALLREQNALLRQILAKDTGISTRDIFNAVRSENRDYINRNGESAFAY